MVGLEAHYQARDRESRHSQARSQSKTYSAGQPGANRSLCKNAREGPGSPFCHPRSQAEGDIYSNSRGCSVILASLCTPQVSSNQATKRRTWPGSMPGSPHLPIRRHASMKPGSLRRSRIRRRRLCSAQFRLQPIPAGRGSRLDARGAQLRPAAVLLTFPRLLRT